jgi:MoaA/NifB/PqqE/SkfB family radical SAM enzyme
MGMDAGGHAVEMRPTVDEQIEMSFQGWRETLDIREAALKEIIAQNSEDKASRLIELSDVYANKLDFNKAQENIDEALRISRAKGADTVRSFTYFITELCNLRCEHCFIYDEVAGPFLKRSDELKTENVIKIIKNIKKSPQRNVFLSGGEVFARPDFEEIVCELTNDGVRFAFGTNGMFPKRLDDILSRQQVRDCLDNVQFSIDGTKEAHERVRGKDTFEPLMEAIKIAKSHGISINATTVIQEHNADDMEAFRDFIKELGITHRFQLHAKGTRLHTPDLKRWHKFIGTGEFHMASLHPLIPGTGCLAGIQTASIRSNGVVEACRMSVVANVPKLIMGDLKDHDFDIDKLLRSNMAQGTQNVVRECRGCALYCGR